MGILNTCKKTHMMLNKKNINAFTLVELLVVISIIALLLAILMPSLAKARRQAQKVVCSSSLHQQFISFSNYAADNKGKYPPGLNWGHFPFGTFINSAPNPNETYNVSDPDTWDYSGQASLLVGGYLDSGSYFFCNSAKTSNKQVTFDWFVENSLGGNTSFDFKNMSGDVYVQIMSGYAYWIAYRDDPALFGFKRANRVASSSVDRSDKAIMSDLATTNSEGPDCASDPGYISGVDWEVYAVNHMDRGKVEGCNVLRNGGDVTWENFDKMVREGPEDNGIHYKRMIFDNGYWEGVLYSWF